MRYSEVLAGQEPDISHIITEDDEPVDNLFSEHQQRLLADGLHHHWHSPDGQPFLAVTNVGLFYAVKEPPIVPDFMLSVGVEYPANYWEKRHRTYFVWEFGKPPDLAVEIVSNVVGNELDTKFDLYAQAGVTYYVVYDPAEHYGTDALRAFVRAGDEYIRLPKPYFAMLNLGCMLWEGEYAGMQGTWLRWTHPDGTMILTDGEASLLAKRQAEKAESALQQAHAEAQQAQAEAQQEKLRAEKLAATLRQMGMNPDDVL